MDKVIRTGISFEPKLLKLFDRFIKEKGYTNRSEAINDIIRDRLFHRHESQIVSSMHTYLDHHNCLELIVVKGKVDRIKKLIEKIKGTDGVKKAELILERKF